MTLPSTHIIIGGRSQDGILLSDLLLRESHTVVSTSRSYAHQTESQNLIQYKLDPTSTFELIKLLQKHNPSHIYLFSAQSSVGLSHDYPLDTLQSNLHALVSLLESIKYLGISPKVFYPLSSDMFGSSSSHSDEETPFRPGSPYSISKACCYEFIKYYRLCHGLKIYCGIFSNHESPLRSSHFVTHKIIRAAIQASIDPTTVVQFGNLDIVRDWGWAEEYISYIPKIMALKDPDDFIIATGFSCSLSEFASYAFDYLGLDYRRHLKPTLSLARPSDIDFIYLSNDKLFKAVGSVPTITAPSVATRLVSHLSTH